MSNTPNTHTTRPRRDPGATGDSRRSRANGRATSAERFLVTVTGNGSRSRARAWDASAPLMLGHPARWVLEKTGDGIRVRDVGGPIGQILESAVTTLPLGELGEGKTIPLPGTKNGLQLRIEPVRAVAPVFRTNGGKAALTEAPRAIDVYECLGNCITQHARVGSGTDLLNSFVAAQGDRPIFEITLAGQKARISVKADGVRLGSGTSPASAAKSAYRELRSGETVELSAEETLDATISFGNRIWHFQASSAAATAAAPEAAKSLKESIRAWLDSLDEEARWFMRALQYTLAAFTVFMVVVNVWPEPDPAELAEEIIPPQFAKIVMKPAEKKPGGAPTETAKAAKDTAVAKAFRAQAVQKSMSNLLKGGVSSLLKQSSLMSAADSSKSRSILAATGKPSRDIAAAAAERVKARDVAVGAVGGTEGGYADSQAKGVTGQGGAFLALETDESFVQEGLSKDEVGKVIHAHMAEVRYCYESALLRNPDVEGRVVIDFVIATNGRVNSFSVKDSTVKDARLDDCVLRRLKTWQFPKPKGGSKVAVSYPFVFKVLGN